MSLLIHIDLFLRAFNRITNGKIKVLKKCIFLTPKLVLPGRNKRSQAAILYGIASRRVNAVALKCFKSFRSLIWIAVESLAVVQ